MCSAEKLARRSKELSGGGCRPLCSVIPGRPKGPDPESRFGRGVGFWIPGSLVSLAPRNDGEGALKPVPEPMPARPLAMPGLSSASRCGSGAGASGRCALARVGFIRGCSAVPRWAGSFLGGRAGSRGGLPGDFAIEPIWAESRGGERADNKPCSVVPAKPPGPRLARPDGKLREGREP